jgi:hypothetical protein
MVTVDSSGFLTGSYTTTLILTANPAVPSSPVSIPITLIVAEDISAVYMPVLLK